MRHPLGSCVGLELELLSWRQASGVGVWGVLGPGNQKDDPGRGRTGRRRGDSARDGARGQIQGDRSKRSEWQVALGRAAGRARCQEKGVLEMDRVTGRRSHAGTKGNL